MSDKDSSSDNRQSETQAARPSEPSANRPNGANSQRRRRRRPATRDRKPVEETREVRTAPASQAPGPAPEAGQQAAKNNERKAQKKEKKPVPTAEKKPDSKGEQNQSRKEQKPDSKGEQNQSRKRGEKKKPADNGEKKQSANGGEKKPAAKGEQKRDERKGARGKNQRGGNRPLISIITITYNASRELEPTMKSVREQTFKNFEHLIIDGASTDDTIITARLNKSPNMRIFSEPDEGLYDAMNKGLRLARGQYVLFMNAGDTFHSPDSLGRYARAAENNNADIVYGDTVIVNEERQVLRPRHLSVPASLTSRSFLKGMLICHQALMVKKEIAPEYDLRYRFSADYDWAIKVINKSRPGKRINLQTVTTDYLDAGLTEKNKLKSLRERFRVMSDHYGTGAALMAHLSFIPRALGRRLGKK